MQDHPAQKMTNELPLALEHVKEMGDRIRGKTVVVFIDYDGTLTPIAESPEQARLSEEMRQALRDLAGKCTVAIVSGRDLENVRNMVGIDGIVYAGSHGFDISGPGGHMDFQQGVDYLPVLDQAEKALQRLLQEVPGCQIERKRFAIAIHFRRVGDLLVPKIESAVDEVLSLNKGLRKTGGKKIFELRPDIEWDKGKAITWIQHKLDLARENVLTFYLGDDLTDEDGFRELRDHGIGILVRDENRPTLARYAVDNPEDVRLFLHMLGEFIREETS
jgi:trehalose-phosphatase